MTLPNAFADTIVALVIFMICVIDSDALNSGASETAQLVDMMACAAIWALAMFGPWMPHRIGYAMGLLAVLFGALVASTNKVWARG